MCVWACTFKLQLPLSFGGAPLHPPQEQHLGESASCTPQSPFSVCEAQDSLHKEDKTSSHYEAVGGAHNLGPSWKEKKGEFLAR